MAHAAHAHGHGHAHGDASHAGHGHGIKVADGEPRRALIIALGLTLSFFVVEVIVGIWSGSLALLADAGHMLGDSSALLVSLAVAQIAARPRTSSKTYGYRRAEVLGALVNAIALGIGGVYIVIEAVKRLADPPHVHAHGMLGAAVAGLFVNLLAAWILHRRGGSSVNVRAAMAHVLGDALGSVAAIGAGVALLFFEWRLADPIASILIAVLLAWGSIRLVREVTHLLMEGTPPGVKVEDLEREIRETPGVASLHDLHVWELTPGDPMLTAHVVLEHGSHGTEVVQRVATRLKSTFNIQHVTIQPEPPEDHPPVVLRLSKKSVPPPPASSA